MNQLIFLSLRIVLLLAPLAQLHAADAAQKPNILVILADDLGYADLGCQGSREAVTPQIDSLAAQGVRCTAGYVTAPQCCPSRAGLITGRYQNRFGFEANWPAALSGKAGLPTSERTVADQLHAWRKTPWSSSSATTAAPPVNHARGLMQSSSRARTRRATILAVASRATCWRAASASRFSCSGKAASQPAEPSTSL